MHDTVGVYKSTKCPIEIILEPKVGNDKLWNPGFVYENKGTIVI